VGIVDRLENLARSYFQDDWRGSKNSARNGDPDYDAAVDELNDFLRGGGFNGAAGRGRPGGGNGSGGRAGARTSSGGDRSGDQASRAAGKPAAPETLRADFAELGLGLDADAAACKAAYKKLLKEFHPDRYSKDAAAQNKATDRAARINIAYDNIEKWRAKG
jgi:DnaJ-domain-containing protein 1